MNLVFISFLPRGPAEAWAATVSWKLRFVCSRGAPGSRDVRRTVAPQWLIVQHQEPRRLSWSHLPALALCKPVFCSVGSPQMSVWEIPEGDTYPSSFFGAGTVKTAARHKVSGERQHGLEIAASYPFSLSQTTCCVSCWNASAPPLREPFHLAASWERSTSSVEHTLPGRGRQLWPAESRTQVLRGWPKTRASETREQNRSLISRLWHISHFSQLLRKEICIQKEVGGLNRSSCIYLLRSMRWFTFS